MKLRDNSSAQATKRFKTLEKDLLKVHNSYYSYKETAFKNMSTKITINCPTHGKFNQLPFNHLNGSGCPECGKQRKNTKNKKYTDTHIQEKANLCSSRGEFRTKFIKEYNCAINRKVYEQVCAHMPDEYNIKKSTEAFKQEVEDLVASEYTVDTDYINSKTKLTITHNTCNTAYLVTPASFLRGRRCPTCATTGFNKSKPATLYYLEISIKGTVVYKIGVTNNTVSTRYSLAEQETFNVLMEIPFDVGNTAYEKEQSILKLFKEYKYEGPPILHRGNTELFNRDIKEFNDFTDIIQEYEDRKSTAIQCTSSRRQNSSNTRTS